jgi:hypothetical protein
MAIKRIGSLYGNFRSKFLDNFYLTNAEAQVEGRAYTLTSNRLTKSGGTGRVMAIGAKNITAGTDVKGYVEAVLDGDILKCDYTGTPDVGFVVGCQTACLDANGDNVDAANITGGHLTILSIDTVNKKVVVVPTKTFTQAD